MYILLVLVCSRHGCVYVSFSMEDEMGDGWEMNERDRKGGG